MVYSTINNVPSGEPVTQEVILVQGPAGMLNLATGDNRIYDVTSRVAFTTFVRDAAAVAPPDTQNLTDERVDRQNETGKIFLRTYSVEPKPHHVAIYKNGVVTLNSQPTEAARRYLGLPSDFDYHSWTYPMVIYRGVLKVEIRMSELSEQGSALINAYQNQYGALLEARGDNVIKVTLARSDYNTSIHENHYEDNDRIHIAFRIDDILTSTERARLSGVPGLNKSYWSGKMGLLDPIPTEEFFRERAGRQDAFPRFAYMTWFVPPEIIMQVRKGMLQGTHAVNAAGQALCEFCEKHRYRVSELPSEYDPIEDTWAYSYLDNTNIS